MNALNLYGQRSKSEKMPLAVVWRLFGGPCEIGTVVSVVYVDRVDDEQDGHVRRRSIKKNDFTLKVIDTILSFIYRFFCSAVLFLVCRCSISPEVRDQSDI